MMFYNEKSTALINWKNEVLTLEVHPHVRLLAFLVDFSNDACGSNDCQVKLVFRGPLTRCILHTSLIDGED